MGDTYPNHDNDSRVPLCSYHLGCAARYWSYGPDTGLTVILQLLIITTPTLALLIDYHYITVLMFSYYYWHYCDYY